MNRITPSADDGNGVTGLDGLRDDRAFFAGGRFGVDGFVVVFAEIALSAATGARVLFVLGDLGRAFSFFAGAFARTLEEAADLTADGFFDAADFFAVAGFFTAAGFFDTAAGFFAGLDFFAADVFFFAGAGFFAAVVGFLAAVFFAAGDLVFVAAVFFLLTVLLLVLALLLAAVFLVAFDFTVALPRVDSRTVIIIAQRLRLARWVSTDEQAARQCS